MDSTELWSCDVGIVGAGAAGLWAAERAARAGATVVVLEKTPRTGTKVLASGGTHCNLTTTLDARAAGELFGPVGARFLAPALRALSPSDVRDAFAQWGVETVEAPLEKIFPKSGRARDVRDAMERAARAAGARIVCDAPVRSIAPEDGGWSVTFGADHAAAGGEDATLATRKLSCARLIVSPGGMSYPRSGTTGEGYRWLSELELPIVEPVPALVPLTSSAAWVHELTGIALADVEVRLVDERRRLLARRRRPLLFTHQGVSGPAAMDVSEHVARAEALARRRATAMAALALEVDLAPDLSREAVRDELIALASKTGEPSLARSFSVRWPKRLVQAVARQAGLGDVDPRVKELDRASRHALVESLKALKVPIDGTRGFDFAEVTAGGLALTHVDPGTMRVRGHEGLYACGEILDLSGPIGGLNFQAAFATAELAAADASRRT